MASEETVNGLDNNLTITIPSNTSWLYVAICVM